MVNNIINNKWKDGNSANINSHYVNKAQPIFKDF